MTAQDYPAQLPIRVIPPDDQPGDAPEGADGIEAGPAGMPAVMNPSSDTVAGSVTAALAMHSHWESRVEGFGPLHQGELIPNMPDPQLPSELNALLGNPEMTA